MTAELAQPLVGTPERGARRLRRDIGFFGLLFASFGSIIGAGWLFGALYASSLAGPAAVISWVIGGGALMLLAFAHAELGGMYPVAGGSARFPRYAFGNLVGFTSGWIAFLGAVTVAPIMVEATLLYTSNYVSSLTTVSGGRPVLTAQGYVAAAALLLLFCTINVLGVRWLAETNMLAVCWKLFVPVVAVVALIATSAHTENFSANGGFMPFGWKGVFLALSAGGVIFAGLGFEQSVQLGGETRNPSRNIPLAIIGGMVVAIVLYIALQVAFILALAPRPPAPGGGVVRRFFLGEGPAVRSVRRAGDRPRPGLARSPALHGCNRLARGDRPSLHRGECPTHLRPLSKRLHPAGLCPAHATRNAPLCRRILVRLWPGDPPPLPALAGAGRLHLGGRRGRLRNGAGGARCSQASGPCAAPPFQASGGINRRSRSLHHRERDPALHRLGRDLEADRCRPAGRRTALPVESRRQERAGGFARLAWR